MPIFHSSVYDYMSSKEYNVHSITNEDVPNHYARLLLSQVRHCMGIMMVAVLIVNCALCMQYVSTAMTVLLAFVWILNNVIKFC